MRVQATFFSAKYQNQVAVEYAAAVRELTSSSSLKRTGSAVGMGGAGGFGGVHDDEEDEAIEGALEAALEAKLSGFEDVGDDFDDDEDFNDIGGTGNFRGGAGLVWGGEGGEDIGDEEELEALTAEHGFSSLEEACNWSVNKRIKVDANAGTGTKPGAGKPAGEAPY